MSLFGLCARWSRASTLIQHVVPPSSLVWSRSSVTYRSYPGLRTAATSKKKMKKMQVAVNKLVYGSASPSGKEPKKPVQNPRRENTFEEQNDRIRPQVLLPNWYIKCVRPGHADTPEDEVQFHVPLKMTKFDIKNYLRDIYGLKIKSVRTRIQMGKLRFRLRSRSKRKDPDFKVAYVTLKEGTFKFPDAEVIFPDLKSRQLVKKKIK